MDDQLAAQFAAQEMQPLQQPGVPMGPRWQLSKNSF
jgi:hypothetical protein